MSVFYACLNTLIYPKKYRCYWRICNQLKMSTEQIDELRLKKLNKLVEYHMQLPAYRDLCIQNGYDGRPLKAITDIAMLPIMTKGFIRDHEADIRARCLNARRYSTSGSTGENFYFYLDNSVRAAHAATSHLFTARIYSDEHIRKPGMMLGIWGGNLHKPDDNARIIAIKQKVLRTKILPGYGMNTQTALTYIQKINELRPTCLYGYPTYLDKLVYEGERAGAECFSPPIIITSGEQLIPAQRERIERYFGRKLFNRYGSVEMSNIGHEFSDHDGMYVNPLSFIIKTNDEDELLITDLDNYATPFIQYNIGDRGKVSRRGAWVTIIDLFGRSNDVIETPSGRIIPSQFFTILSKMNENILRFQIVQTGKTALEMHVISEDDVDDEKIISDFDKNFGDEMTMRVVRVNQLVSTAYGKHKFIVKLDKTKGRL